MLPLVVAAIFALAVLFSMLGLGGALLYTPVLKWFGFEFKSVVIPTSLFLNGLTTLSAAVAYGRAGLVDVRGALPMIATSLVAAPLGAWGTQFVPTETLVLLFALGMVVAGGRMLLTAHRPEPEALMPVGRRAVLTGLAGLGVGAIAGLLGIGGGFLFVPILIAVGYPTKQAAATTAFAVVFSSFSGFAGHVAVGHFHWPLLLGAGAAVIVASQLGAWLMRERLKARWIKQGFGVLLVAIAVKLAWPILGL